MWFTVTPSPFPGSVRFLSLLTGSMGERVEREDSVATGFRTGNPKPQSSTAVIVRYIVGWL